MDRYRAVVEGAVIANRGTNDEDRQQILRLSSNAMQSLSHFIQHDILKQQIINGVAGNAQLGKDCCGNALGIKLASSVNDLARVSKRLSGMNRNRHRSNAREALIVKRMEVQLSS
ncbi:Uncharacterised protein [Chlamydia trachomatis]|nr:Uncharacterised protein [Chlamydia trachomatis]